MYPFVRSTAPLLESPTPPDGRHRRPIVATLFVIAALGLSAPAAAQPTRTIVVDVVNGTGDTLVVDCNGITSHPIRSRSHHNFRYQSARTDLSIDCVAWDVRGNVIDRTALQLSDGATRGEWRVGGQGRAQPPRREPPAAAPRRAPPPRQAPRGHGQPGHSH